MVPLQDARAGWWSKDIFKRQELTFKRPLVLLSSQQPSKLGVGGST